MKFILVNSLLLIFQATYIQSLLYESKFFLKFFFNAESDVKFFLYTRRNSFYGQEIILGDIDSVYHSNYNSKNPTKFLIHGWRADLESPFNENVRTEFLIKDDVNIIKIDWSKGAQTLNYILAARRVPKVGKILGSFIDFMNAYGVLKFNDVTIIGFSLGSHVAGFAGKNVQRGKIKSIIGLDPAGPLFNDKSSDGRLHFGDASYVEVIHTNMGLQGMSKMIGHIDIVANNGKHQPGCSFFESCSHTRAPEYYIESINMHPFYARKCFSFDDIERESCRGEIILMGYLENSSKNLSGIFHLTTNSKAPFSQVIPEI